MLNMLRRIALLICLACIVFAGEETDFLAKGKEGWRGKVNASFSFADGVLAMSVETSRYDFGWMQHTIPIELKGKICGFAGRVRLKEGSGSLGSIINVGRDATRRQYRQYVTHLLEGDSQWHEFYLPVGLFSGVGNATGIFSDKMLQEDDSLELMITGLFSKTTIEFDSLRVVTKDEPTASLRHLESLSIQLKLRGLDTVHPRIILYGKKLEEIRAKATMGGMEQAGYDALISWADKYLSWPDGPNWAIGPNGPFWSPSQGVTTPRRRDDDTTIKIWPNAKGGEVAAVAPVEKQKKHYDPCQALLEYQNSSGLTAHQNRGRYEGVLVSAVTPIEPLAAVGLITGDERYSRKAAEIMVKLAGVITTNTKELNLGFFYTRTFYVRALALGYDWCWHVMTPEERKLVKTTLLGFVLDIYNRAWSDSWGMHPLERVWNWDPGIVSCAGLGMLALEGETKVQEEAIIFQMRRHLKDYLTLGIDFDGCCHEGPSYICYGIGSGIIFMEALRMQGRGDLFTETNAHLVAPWIAYEMLPGGKVWNNLSDCNFGTPMGGQFYHYAMGRYAELAKADPARSGERLPSPPTMTEKLEYLSHFREAPGPRHLSYGTLGQVMAWSFNKGNFSPNPALSIINTFFFKSVKELEDPATVLPQAMHFRGRGLAVSRVGFGKDSLHLAIEAGPHAAGHDQSDKGAFTLRAYGMEAFIDSGYGNDSDPKKSGSSYAHNMVLIDGIGEPMSGHNNSNGYISGYRHTDRYDWIRVDAEEAWNKRFGRGLLPQDTGMNVERYRREWVLVRPQAGSDVPPYLVVYDDIRKKDGKPHAFTWLWHFDGRYKVDVAPENWTLRTNDMHLPILITHTRDKDCAVQFEAVIPKDGDYRIIGLTAALGPVLDQSDSFFLSVNGSEGERWDLNTTRSFSWSEYRHFGDALPVKYSFKAGEKVSILVSRREWHTALARLLVLPYDAKPPLTPTGNVPDGVSLDVSQAKQVGKYPFDNEIYGLNDASPATVTVYPLNTQGGETSCDWFETSRIGVHPYLKHTVSGMVNPQFLMVIVPRRDDKQPLPSIKRLSSTSVQVTWPGRTDTIEIGSDEPLK